MAKSSDQKQWCSCSSWKRFCAYLKNLNRAKFCPFCGSKLLKKEEVEEKQTWESG